MNNQEYIKPMVTIELEEYLQTQKYMKILEDDGNKPYKEALNDILSLLFMGAYESNFVVPYNKELQEKISKILIKNNVLFYHTHPDNKIILTIKKN